MHNLHDVDLKNLRIFNAVVECGGFTAAENMLNVSCSTISKAMSDLEERLGMSLCKRGRAGFELTEQGEKLYQCNGRLFSAIENYLRDVAQLDRQQRVLRIAAVDNTTPDPNCPLVPALRRLQQAMPHVIVDLSIMAPDEITLGLLKGDLDLGLTLVHRKVAGLRTTALYDERVRPYVSVVHEDLWRKPTVSLADIASLRLTTYTHREPGPLLLSGVRQSFYFCPQMEGVLMLVLAGNHVGMLPRFYAQSWEEKGQIKPLAMAELCMDSPVVAMSQSEGPRQDLVDYLLAMMRGERVSGH